MFERRLKIVLILIFAGALVLAARAMQVQVLNRSYWSDEAAKASVKERLIDTGRGRILDFKNREIAVDQACIDACVDYRAITREPDAEWVKRLADVRVRKRDEWRGADRALREQLMRAEIDAVRSDINRMWTTLAARSHQTVEQMDETRTQIEYRVNTRRRVVWFKSYEKAVKLTGKAEKPPWYQKWLLGDE